MKRICAMLMILWSSIIPLYAAMSDATALKQAKMIFGNQAAIETVRDILASNWTKQIGVKSIGCANDFTAFGTGFNTWDAAFADWAVHPASISGPFKGTVNFKATAWDNNAVTKFDFIIDSGPLNSTISLTPAQSWSVSVPVSTTLLTTGVHVVCAYAQDAAGLVGRSAARLFSVDQSVATSPADFYLQASTPDGHPTIGTASAIPPPPPPTPINIAPVINPIPPQDVLIGMPATFTAMITDTSQSGWIQWQSPSSSSVVINSPTYQWSNPGNPWPGSINVGPVAYSVSITAPVGIYPITVTFSDWEFTTVQSTTLTVH